MSETEEIELMIKDFVLIGEACVLSVIEIVHMLRTRSVNKDINGLSQKAIGGFGTVRVSNQ